MKYEFVVTVDTDSEIHAVRAISERIDFDEDYGFSYTITWEVKK